MAGMGGLGELLRQARVQKGLSLAQVEEATRIRSAYLEALEEEAFGRLPAPVYVRGFLKNYAVYLGLDPREVLALYQASEVPAVPAVPSAMLDEPLEKAVRWRRSGLMVLPLAALALVVTVWWGYARFGNRIDLRWPFGRPAPTATPTPTLAPTDTLTPLVPTATPAPPTATPSPTWTAEPTATPTPTVITSLELRIEVFGERAWLLVQTDDQRAFAGILEPGATNVWTARERIVLRCGNAGAVRVVLNGQPLGVLGDAGQVVDREWTVPGIPTLTPVPTATP